MLASRYGWLLPTVGVAGVSLLLGRFVALDPSLALAAAAVVVLAWVAVARPVLTVPVIVLAMSLPSSGWGSALGIERVRLPALIGLTALAYVSATSARSGLRKGTLWPRALFVLLFLGAQAAVVGSKPVAQRAFEITLAFMVAGLVYRSAASGDPLLSRALRAVVALMVGEAALGILQLGSSRPILMSGALDATSIEEATNISGYFRGLGTFYHPNSLALALTFTLPLALWTARSKTGSLRIASLAPAVVMAAGIIASLSRAGIAAVGLTIIASFAVLRDRRQLARIAALLLISAGLVFTVPTLHHALSRFTSSAAASRDQGSDTARAANQSAALAVFRAHPVAGTGLGSGATEGSQYGGYTDQGAHNAFLDVLEGGGIILVALALLLVAGLYRDVLSAFKKRNPLVIVVPVAFLYCFFESIFQGLFVLLLASTLALMRAESTRLR